MRHENACLLRWPKPGLTTAPSHQKPDKISGNRGDSDTYSTGPTLTTVAAATEEWAGFEPQALSLACHTYTHTLLGVVDECVKGPSGLPLKGTREHSAIKRLWPNKDATTRFPVRA